MFALSWDSLEPTEYGLVRNGLTGSVDVESVYAGGRHLLGPVQSFIRFPSTQQNVEFSARHGAQEGVVAARTGKENPEDPGGQPVDLSVSFQYKLLAPNMGHIYRTFGSLYERSIIRFAHMEVTNSIQFFTPSQFWQQRDMITQKLVQRVNASLHHNAFCELTGFNLLRADFHPQYENTIVSMKLQEQIKITKEYQQSVTNVLRQIDVMEADYNQQIQAVTAQANSKARSLINLASTKGFEMVQGSKATAYRSLQAALQLNSSQLVQYIKIKTVNQQANKMVGVDQLWKK